MFIDDLKKSILHKAIQGKLVEQNPNDEPASQLLKRIREEKEKLIKDGKIKKEKSLSPITDEEKPFDIPGNWERCRWGNIVNIVSARRVHQKDWKSEGIPFYRAREIAKLADKGFVDNELFISEELYTSFSSYGIPHSGDLMVTAVGTLGKTYIVKETDKFYYKDASVICLENFAKLNPSYLRYVMNSELMKNQIRSNSNGTAVDTLTMVRMVQYIVPLPPLEEQKRIVAKLDELMFLLDEARPLEEEITKLEKDFPSKLRQSILQYAIQGKLVEQNSGDEPASELLKKIKEEKEKLIKEGKIKKEKTLEPITDEEKPFDIPSNWEWVRLGEISTYSQTKKKINAQYADPETRLLDMEDIKKGGTLLVRKSVSESNAIGEKTVFNKGNILYSKLRPYLLKILIADDDGICTPELVPFSMFGNISSKYIVYYLKSPYVDFVINSDTYGIKMPRVGTDTMINLLIPLPPLGEQKRIAAKLDELMKLCDELEEQIG